MCGIAGIVDLSGRRPVAPGLLERMADAIWHRGPDEAGYFDTPGLGLANRRLSIVGLKDGRQPLYNEDRSVAVVFNGELFDYPEMKAKLESRGHRFVTSCDTELIPHLWEDHQEGVFEHLHGQFAIALWDQRRQLLVLARDRFGICPLYWTTQRHGDGEWLLFASEVKALLASGMVTARPDVRGIDQVFNFFAVPGPATCFQGVSYLQPGHYLKLQLDPSGGPARLSQHRYWQMDFPDRGQEVDGDQDTIVNGLERVLLGAVERRLRADVPVVSYLSGGIDSSTVVAMASKIRGSTIPTFTIQIRHPKLDETSQAAMVSRHIGANPVVVSVGDAEVLESYPELIRATEAPVVDTSCTALLRLARSVHEHGYKVALTGEGSDEWLAGYVWYKIFRIFSAFDSIPGVRLSPALHRLMYNVLGGTGASLQHIGRMRRDIGGDSAFQIIYGIMGLTRPLFYSPEMLESLRDYSPYLELEPDLERMRRWHPMNRAFFWAGRVHLAGQLLHLKGDRLSMNSSVEMRYPFLDEEVFDYLARLHPRWKMNGLREKYILRLLGQRYLPHEVAWRPKGMFRAPLDSFHAHKVPAFIEQLLSPESLRRTGYFNVEAVRYWSQQVREQRVPYRRRVAIELGLVAVTATQLWYHLFIDGSLAEIPGAGRPVPALAV